MLKGSDSRSVSPSLRSIHTNTLPEILDSNRSSLAVTTYQAKKLVLLRPESRDNRLVLNTHFRNFDKPMGFAWEPGRFAVGTLSEIWEFHDIPAVGRKLDLPSAAHAIDAAFLPRVCHMTGNMQIHEMAWVPRNKAESALAERPLSELWFVNTRFSCLGTRSGQYSFVPRWKPPFITALAPEDRCHLNGLCLRDDRLRYVTALGSSDKPAGWRENKRAGGILMDLQTNEIIVRGLSMPHSPRWHNGRLWLLESGNGGLGIVDESTGRYEEICRLPGFTRGLDFIGPIAFVGLSQVRETAVFNGIAVAEIPQEKRFCGVWAVDTRNGKIVGFARFTEGVQEIFAVHVLAGMVWPDVLNEGEKQIEETYELPDEALREVPEQLRSATKTSNKSLPSLQS